jgi:4-amino-4-deoxy-L-arabinose transferase-like glycosyltransferase
MTVLDRISTGWKAWVILFLLTFGAAAPGVFLLPALDRDESRFAQASKEMLEENNYILIQYQDELRNKKPAGIHWLQAASTALLTGPEAKQIWTYRVPNWLAVAFASMACFWAGIPLIGRRAAFLGAALFGASLLLTSEGHISKTDGVLIFLTTLGIGALGRLYLGTDKPGRMAFLVWLTVSASFLIKGPVTMMVVAFAGFGAYVWDKAAEGRGGDWWRPLARWTGPALFVAMVLPWFLWIQAATDGAYIEGAVGKDLADKFTGASEGHSGWFLYHLTHIPAWSPP